MKYSKLSNNTRERIESMELLGRGGYDRVVEDLLKKNPRYTERDVINFLDNFKKGDITDYFRARFLARGVHAELTYENVKDLNSTESCRIEDGIPALMEKDLSFEQAHKVLEGFSHEESSLLALQLKLGLSVEEAKNNILNAPFHKTSFLGEPALWKTIIYYLIGWIPGVVNALSWPMIPLTYDHTFLIGALCRVKDGHGQIPPVKKVIDWVGSFDETNAIILHGLIQNIRKQLNQADQRDVMREQELWFQRHNSQQGRPCHSAYHEPPIDGSRLSLRIEGNQYNGNLLCDSIPNYESLDPIQVFILAACQRYGLTDINAVQGQQTPSELLEFASGFIGHRIEKDDQSKRYGSKEGSSFATAMEQMSSPQYTIHERFIAGNIASLPPYTVSTETIHENVVRRQPPKALTLTQAQAVVSSCRDNFFHGRASEENKLDKIFDEAMSGKRA